MSDHLPILTLLRQTKINNKSSLIFESRNLTEKKTNKDKTGTIQNKLDKGTERNKLQ